MFDAGSAHFVKNWYNGSWKKGNLCKIEDICRFTKYDQHFATRKNILRKSLYLENQIFCAILDYQYEKDKINWELS